MATRIGDRSDSKKGNKSTNFEGTRNFDRFYAKPSDFRTLEKLISESTRTEAEKKKFFSLRRVDLECIFQRILEIQFTVISSLCIPDYVKYRI